MSFKDKKLVFTGLILLASLLSLSCDQFNRQVTYSRARSFHDAGKYDEAIQIYQKLIENDAKDDSEVHYDLGVAYAEKGEMGLAKEQVDILKKSGREDLAQVLETVMRDATSLKKRQDLHQRYEDEQQSTSH